ncbi:electron transport complex subunit RnfG [Clostridium homopropionicum DSM 5847]|uniref:Ion-translocating oxidoreductase complex subunit G n=1 Tax=Clostridium homopropionicum DSM 5847 TaxID=1121318 RepID=A0A0L6ZEP4_9CLOT|nr:RnfABCDGE type electron transport complex subunit G [Clostridium homopropionicum]KOA21459.1 electron transport complex subunit RnfG [Clostridium homopropionicum DSM 5847]SFG09069.1 electron transport complex protein RnfG [Clostridium homopropionicum]
MENQTSNKEIIALGIRLLIITAIAALILGWAHKITLDPIKQQNIKTNNEAMKEVLPSAESFQKIASKTPEAGEKLELELKADSAVSEVNKAVKGSDTVGYTVKISTKGYGGLIEMVVGISKEGKVEGIKILNHSETPGLGAKAPEPEFSGQFKGKPTDKPLVVVKTAPSGDNQIQAITGSTITSNAVTKGVNDAVDFFKTELKGGQK